MVLSSTVPSTFTSTANNATFTALQANQLQIQALPTVITQQPGGLLTQQTEVNTGTQVIIQPSGTQTILTPSVTIAGVAQSDNTILPKVTSVTNILRPSAAKISIAKTGRNHLCSYSVIILKCDAAFILSTLIQIYKVIIPGYVSYSAIQCSFRLINHLSISYCRKW